MKRSLAMLFGASLLSGCANLTPDWLPWTETLTPCEKLDALVNAYDNRFEELKKHRVSSTYMETWQARYDLIGDDCRIYAIDQDTVSYQCVEHFKKQASAVAAHREAASQIRECIANQQWLEKEVETDESLKNTFILNENTPAITVHTGKTLSRFHPWVTSVEVGKSAGE